MAIRSGFFMSVNGDRKYNAAFFAEFFGTLIGNGVFPNPSNGLQIISNDDMTVTMKPGKAWINGYYFVNDADYILTLDTADGVLNRIDRIVLQYNALQRDVFIVVKKGTPASTSVAPVLQRDVDIYEIALADIAVNKGAISISQSNITDLRLNSEYCGIVHGLVDQVDTTSIFNQYLAWFNKTKVNMESELEDFQTQAQEEFQTWFDSVKGILEGDVAANLAQQIQSLQTEVQTLSETVTTHKNDYVLHPAVATTTNVDNAYSITLDPAPLAYVNGMGLILTINANSTGNSTINVNGLGAIPIKKANGNSVNNLKANGVYTLRYSSAQSAFILQGEGGEYGNATANDVIEGKTIGTENGLVVGNIPNYGRAVLGQGYTTPKSYLADGGGSLVIEPYTGYYEEGLNNNNFGSIILSDGNYKAENILPGKSIFGLAGTASVKKWATGTSGIIPKTVYTPIAFLDFTPSIFLAFYYANDGYYVKYYFSMVSPILLSSYHTTTSTTVAYGPGSMPQYGYGITIDTNTNTVSVKPAFNGNVTQGFVDWIAIE